MKKIIIGGVPEHFNLPWHLTRNNKEYEEKGVQLHWKDFYGGTGQMCKALREKEIDIAIILTEGIIRDIINGNHCKIVQVFVESPLVWGIHVANNSSYHKVSDIKGMHAAISRFGSGSHLMAYINAENNGWDTKKELHFEVIKNLEGAVKGLPKGVGDYFMWEKFTTKPYVDNGVFRLIDECPTPWPCFVIAVRNEVLEKEEGAIKTILSVINQTTQNFKKIPAIDQIISKKYEQKLEDVQQWLSITQWSQQNLTEKQANEVLDKLIQLQLIDKKSSSKNLLYSI